jgi:23S rRNA pseudouridine2457 synthase
VLPCSVSVLPEEPALIKTLFTVPAPIQSRVRSDNSLEYTWMNFTLEQGLNRQIRKMCAAVSLPALRIVRHSVGPFSVRDLNRNT